MAAPPGPPGDGICVVVGATGAVGRAVVRRLNGQNRRVLAVARDGAALEEIAGDSVVPCATDISTDQAVHDIAAAVRGPVALALFAAGLPVTGSAEVIEPSALARAADIKVGGVTRLLRALDDKLVEGSRLVAIAGSLGFEPGPRDAAPGTANAALLNLMRQVAHLYGPRGVVVNTIAPGPLDTPRLHAFCAERARESGRSAGELLAAYTDRTSLGHLPTPDEVAWLITTLLAPEARILHGSVLSPDAGARHAIF